MRQDQNLRDRPPQKADDFLSAGGFVGREGEMGRMRAAVDDFLAGRAENVLLVVEGRQGMGKARLGRRRRLGDGGGDGVGIE